MMRVDFDVGWNDVQTSALPLGRMILGKLFNVSEPQFSLLLDGFVD